MALDNTSLWEDWLAALRDLSPLSSEWQTWPAFLDAAREIAEAKAREREQSELAAQRRQELDTALITLRTREDWAFHDLERVPAWRVSACVDDQVEAALEQLRTLDTALTRHDDLVRKVKEASTARALRQSLQESQALAGEINTLYRTLDVILGGSPFDGQPPVQPGDVTESAWTTDAPCDEPSTAGQPDTKVPITPAAQAAPAETKPQPIPAKTGKMLGGLLMVPDQPSEAVSDQTPPPQGAQENPPASRSGALTRRDTERLESYVDYVTNTPVIKPRVRRGAGDGSSEGEALSIPAPEPTRPRSEASTLTPDLAHEEEEHRPEEDVSQAPKEATEPGAQATEPGAQATEPGAQARFWEFVAAGDLAGAYWLARVWEESPGTPLAPAAMLKAALGAAWLQGDDDSLTSPLFQAAQEPSANEFGYDSGATRLLRLAAALYPALAAQASGLAMWLQPPPPACPALGIIVEAVAEFARHGISLRASDLENVADASAREAALSGASRALNEWLTRARQSNVRMLRGLRVHERLLHDMLPQSLSPALEDRREAVAQLRENVRPWQSRSYIKQQVHRIDEQEAGRRTRRIQGEVLQELIEEVEKGCALALRWCDLVEREQLIESRGSWIFDQVRALQKTVDSTMPVALTELRAISSALGTMPPSMELLTSPEREARAEAAAAALCEQSLGRLRAALALTVPTDIDSETGAANEATGAAEPVASAWRWLLPPEGDLDMALARRLLLVLNWEGSEEIQVSALATGNNEGLADGVLHQIWTPDEHLAARLKPTTPTQRAATLQAAFDHWLAARDFAAAGVLLHALDAVDADDGAVGGAARGERFDTTLVEMRAALRQDVFETGNAIESAIVDGVLPEARSGLSGRVEAIDVENACRLRPHFATLEAVRRELETLRAERRDELVRKWEERLKPCLVEADLDQAAREHIARSVEAALDKGDTRIADEYLAQLDQIIEGKPYDPHWFSVEAERDVLRDFHDRLKLLADWLEQQKWRGVADDIKKGRARAGVHYGQQVQRAEKAARAVEAWTILKNKPTSITGEVAVLLRFLGFEVPNDAVREVERGQADVYLEAEMDPRGEFRAPQFGSAAKRRYAILCQWAQPNPEIISQRLRQLKLQDRPVIVLYLNSLGEGRRRAVAARRGTDLPFVILDDMLLLFLTGEEEPRLKSFFNCALPLSSLNPYAPFQAGNVPREMFFGREPLVDQLQAESGPCLVYGGRQLGKSALLRQVAREFHAPQRERYAWAEDIKTIGDPAGQQDVNVIWTRLRHLMQSFHDGNGRPIVSDRISSENPETIYQHIRESIVRVPERRVLIMFDEADHFLDADSRKNFAVVTRLKQLMTDTDRRFKVIFAGLHNVYRFRNFPNQPLAHLGEVLVGPLEGAAARRLVVEPLHALGYRFRDENAALRILSYTNYHAGLIQYFCQQLIQRLHQRAGDQRPPYFVDNADVEAVYRRHDVRDYIKDRFNLTLSLDDRYKAIALRLIFEQIGRGGSFDAPFPEAEIFKLARATWPSGFVETDATEVHGLLDEMCGLGVLTRAGDKEYRLRSPNLVRLMGTPETIFEEMDDLSKKTPRRDYTSESQHFPFENGTRAARRSERGEGRYSPFTRQQEGALISPRRDANAREHNVGFVCGSQALGFDEVEAGFQHLLLAREDAFARTKVVCEALGAEETPDTLLEFVKKNTNALPDYTRFVWWRLFDGATSGEEIARWMRAALKTRGYLEQHRRQRRQRVNLLFACDAAATWHWLLLPEEQRQKLLEQLDASVTLRHWDEPAIRLRLQHRDLMDSPDRVADVRAATGGWGYLLNRFFERCKGDDPRDVVDAFVREAGDPAHELSRGFRAALGVAENLVVRRVWDFLRELSPLTPADLRDNSLIEGVSATECAAAVELLMNLGCLDSRWEEGAAGTRREIFVLDPLTSAALPPLASDPFAPMEDRTKAGTEAGAEAGAPTD